MKKKLTIKLIETNDTPKIGDILRATANDSLFFIEEGDYIKVYEKVGNKLIKPIAISDEEIKVGDNFIANKRILLCTDYLNNKKDVVGSDGTSYIREGIYKIELLPEHFSNDILQLIVDGVLVDGSEIEVQLEVVFNRAENTADCSILLDSNNHASITIPESNFKEVSKEQPITYSEEEVANLLDKYRMYCNKFVTGVNTFGDLYHWFEQNKKK